MDNVDPKPGDHRIEIPSGALSFTVPPATLWQTYSYGREWFSDAMDEAGQAGHGSRRREIVFAVCAAETYLFEWVRDAVLKRDFGSLIHYFPVGKKRGVIQKFKEIPKDLARDGFIPAALNCGGVEFKAFQELVAFRDGLVHASASRPETSNLPNDERPVPSKGALDALPAGWAVGVLRVLLRKLHADTGTGPPAWL